MKVNADYNAPRNVKVATTLSTIATTGLATLALAKGKPKNISKLELGIKEAMLLSMSSIIGGFTGGALADSKNQVKYKLRESSNQIIGNTIIPFSCLAVMNKLTKSLHKGIRAILGSIALIGSTFVGHAIADKINDRLFEEKRKYPIGIKDFITDADDLLFSASTVMGSKTLYHLTACICPFTYSNLGIMAGTRHKTLDKQI